MVISIIILVVILAVLWFVVTYNQLIKWKNLMNEGWSGIDVQLKRRHDLIPNLVETVKGYSRHEKQLFEEVARLRNQCSKAATVKEYSNAESALTHGIQSLFAVAEAYPDLKANQNFLVLHKNLVEIEDEIQMARRYYNGTVRNFNILAESFPSLLVAKAMGFTKADFFRD